jgi:uncharacterized damage-inducible protein DinB
MLKETLSRFITSMEELYKPISSLRQEQFNIVPFEDSWTAGQTAEHILKSNTVILNTVNGASEKTENWPDEKIEQLRVIFLDFDTKMTALGFNTPSDDDKNKAEMLNKLREVNDGIIEVIKTLDLTETCKDFKHPGMGELTRLEWIYFCMFHTQRHTHQLSNIIQKLKESTKLESEKIYR